MKQATKQITNLLILQSSISESVEVTARHLSILARQAYLNRDYSRLTSLADSLINMSARSEAAGRYYQALALSRKWKSNHKAEIQNTFQQLTDTAPLPIRSASLLALGLNAFCDGDYDEAKNLIIEANRMSLSNNLCAPVIAVNAQDALSMILSFKGAHKESLDILRGLRPLVGVVGKFLPTVYYNYLNSNAYEYLSLGDVTTAANLIRKVSRAPMYLAYPEWQETASTLHQAISEKQPAHTRVYVRDITPSNVINIISHLRPNVYQEPATGKADILAFPVPADTFHITLSHLDQSFGLFQFPFYNTEVYHERFIVFVHHLDTISTKEASDFMVRGYISQDDPENCQIERAVDRENLNKLYKLLRFFEEDLKTLDKTSWSQDEPIDLDQIQKTVKYLMPMLREPSDLPPLIESEEPAHIF
jgi:hypothetical protein